MSEAAKRIAAEAAAAIVENGMVLGLGTGSTMRLALAAIARRVHAEGLRIEGIPTSPRRRARPLSWVSRSPASSITGWSIWRSTVQMKSSRAAWR